MGPPRVAGRATRGRGGPRADRAHLRDDAVLREQRAALARRAGPHPDVDRGARDALTWLVEGGPGPLGGRTAGRPPTARAIVHELAAAEAVRATGGDRAGYAAGVEYALMWAGEVTPTPPASVVTDPGGPA